MKNIYLQTLDYEKILPNKIYLNYENKTVHYFLGNIMINSNMIQITYEGDYYDLPSTLEIDFYFTTHVKNNLKKDKYLFDITFGDEVIYSFSLYPNKLVNKFIMNNKTITIKDKSIDSLMTFLSLFTKIKRKEFNFLSQ